MGDLPPEQWDTATAPSPGRLFEAGVSWAVASSVGTGGRWSATLAHGPTGTRATMTHDHRDCAVHAAWVALRDLLLTERTTEP